MHNIKEYLSYNKDTGEFFRIKARFGLRVGDKAGSITNKGYIHIRFSGKSYLAHRLAWFFIHGYLPIKSIDHINGIKTDNRIVNLREVSHRQNMINQKMHRGGKLPGCYYHRQSGLWNAKITTNKITTSLGYFKSEAEASTAYFAAVLSMAGESL